jgi:hypothetical protein
VSQDGRRKGKRRAKLTPLEDHCWISAFCHYLDEGKSDAEADRLAWRDMLSEFPRLRFCGGCK